VIFYKIGKSFTEANRDLPYIDWLPIVSLEKNNKVISPFSKKNVSVYAQIYQDTKVCNQK